MKPRLVQLMTGVMIAGAALAACRREVPTPPTPVPDRTPKPSVLADTRLAAAPAWLAS